MLAILRQRKHANSLLSDSTGYRPTDLAVQEASAPMLSGFTPEGIYSGENVAEGPQIPDPLFPSWLTDLQFDGVAFLSGTEFTPHFV